MKELFMILEALGNESSVNQKENILREQQGNQTLKRFFSYALDPKKRFGFKRFELFSIPQHRENGSGQEFVFSCLERLLSDKKGLKVFIPEVTSKMSFFEQEIFRKALEKDPACGVSEGLVRRVWSDVLPESPKLCKAKPFSHKNLQKISFPAIAQLKADGERVLVFVRDEGVQFISGNGLEFRNLSSLREEVLRLSQGKTGFVLDGELLHQENGKISERAKGNGVCSESIKGTISEEEQENLLILAWDMVPLDDYNTGKGKQPYTERLRELEGFLTDSKKIHLIQTRTVNDLTEAFRFFDEVRADGQEGIILKNRDHLWTEKRSPECVKFKLEISTTLRCLESIPGKPGTKYENCLGAILCESEDSGLRVLVGSGFSDPERKKFWEEPLDGKCVEVVSNGICREKGSDVFSLFLPRFKEVRFDKDEADTTETIEELSRSSEIISNRSQK